MELAHATCPALTPDLMILSNSAQLPLKRLHVQRTVKISKKSNVTSGKTTPIEKAFLDLLNEQRLCIQKNFIRHNRLCQDHLHHFFQKKKKHKNVFFQRHVSSMKWMFPLLFLSYIYIDICSIKFFMFSIYVVSGVSLFCCCHKQKPYSKDWYD